MVATYQSFAGDSKLINKRGVEANLFGQRASSYMEALAAIRPVLIIDEPHRFEGKQTQEYLAQASIPLMTIRFGATFKRDEFKNLIYTLDSLEAFRQRSGQGHHGGHGGRWHRHGVKTLTLHVQVTGSGERANGARRVSER
jgi:type III restriction enzyme